MFDIPGWFAGLFAPRGSDGLVRATAKAAADSVVFFNGKPLAPIGVLEVAVGERMWVRFERHRDVVEQELLGAARKAVEQRKADAQQLGLRLRRAIPGEDVARYRISLRPAAAPELPTAAPAPNPQLLTVLAVQRWMVRFDDGEPRVHPLRQGVAVSLGRRHETEAVDLVVRSGERASTLTVSRGPRVILKFDGERVEVVNRSPSQLAVVSAAKAVPLPTAQLARLREGARIEWPPAVDGERFCIYLEKRE